MKKFILGFFAIIGALVMLTIISIVVLVKYPAVNTMSVPDNTILQINFDREIIEVSGDNLSGIFFKKTMALDEVIRTIGQARKDPKIIGIVAKINDPKMGVAQIQEIRNAVIKFRTARKNTPNFTIAYSDSFGELSQGTGAYYLASAFEEVWMQPMGTVGFTGIAMELPFAKEALEKLHIKPQIGKRKSYKTFIDTITESGLTPENKESMQGVLNSLTGQIVHDVALTRELNDSEVQEAMNHAPLSGKEALTLGLIDRVAHFDTIEKHISQKAGKPISIISFNKYKKSIVKQTHKPGMPKITLVYGTGTIFQDNDEGETDPLDEMAMGSHETAKAIDEAAKDPDVKAIVFRINSGGGSSIASETIRRSIELAKLAGKKVVVSMSDVAGSGGYWIAVNADKIVANPATITGSIGVYAGKIVTQDFWKNLGINWEEVHVGDNATMYLNTKEYTEYGWKRLQSNLDDIYANFVNLVATNRKLTKEHVEEIAQGRIWAGPEALKFGLVDKLGDLSDAINVARTEAGLEKEVIYVDVSPKKLSFIEKLFSSMFGQEESMRVHIPFFNVLIELEKGYRSILAAAQSTIMPVGKPKG